MGVLCNGSELLAGRAMKEELWALDFDGVICDSCGESSLSAWKVLCSHSLYFNCQSSDQAAAKLWPEVLQSSSVQQRKNEIMQKMRIVRPVVETGSLTLFTLPRVHPSNCARYENIVQIRCLLEDISTDEILSNWSELLQKFMHQWQLDRAEVSTAGRGIVTECCDF